ncbi:MAG: Hpt domain-containing protein, partial [Ghiorsea sp.]|nr:Hpt domain-containing protein [Ghiorsea sp.]
MSVDLDQFKQIFYEESFEGLDTMESGLLGMTGGGADLEVVNDVFRAAHSIKGGSATFGFDALASFTHIMEGLLDEMREGKREADTDVVNILLESVDEMRSLMSAYQNDEEPDVEHMQTLQKKLEQVCGMESTPPARDSEQADTREGDITKGDDAEILRHLGWTIEFKPHANMLATGNDPVLLLSELENLGEMTLQLHDNALGSLTDMDPESCYLSWSIKLMGADIEEDQITEIFEWVEDECDLEIIGIFPERKRSDRRVGDRRAPDAQEDRRSDDRRTGPRRPSDKKPAAQATTIRVDTNRIDELIDMVGELVITQSMLGQLGEEFEMDKLVRLREGLEELERNSREIQEAVMRVRMQPISFAFNRFPRMVHDLSQQLSKKVRLE